MKAWEMSWNGRTWRDMPGGSEADQKINFACWRRGLMKLEALEVEVEGERVVVMQSAHAQARARRGRGLTRTQETRRREGLVSEGVPLRVRTRRDESGRVTVRQEGLMRRALAALAACGGRRRAVELYAALAVTPQQWQRWKKLRAAMPERVMDDLVPLVAAMEVECDAKVARARAAREAYRALARRGVANLRSRVVNGSGCATQVTDELLRAPEGLSLERLGRVEQVLRTIEAEEQWRERGAAAIEARLAGLRALVEGRARAEEERRRRGEYEQMVLSLRRVGDDSLTREETR